MMENNRVLQLLLWLDSHLSDYQKTAILPTGWNLKDELELAIKKMYKAVVVFKEGVSIGGAFKLPSDTFEKNFLAYTGLDIANFKRGSLVYSIDEGNYVFYYNGPYILGIKSDEPIWCLYELENYKGEKAIGYISESPKPDLATRLKDYDENIERERLAALEKHKQDCTTPGCITGPITDLC